MEKKIVFISSSKSFIGTSLINFYKKKKYFIISFSENTKFFKKKNHINFSDKISLTKFFSQKSYIDFAYLNHGIIGSDFPIEKLIDSHLTKTKFILKVLKKTTIKRLIYFRSCDENSKFSNDYEKINFNPTNIYGHIKSIATTMIQNHCHIHNINYTFMKLYLVVGKYQKFPRIFKLIKNKIDTNSILSLNDAHSIKNFTHIDDFLTIQKKIIKSDYFKNKSVDLVSDQNISIGNLCSKIKKIHPEFNFIKNKRSKEEKLIPNLKYLDHISEKYDFKNIDQIVKDLL